MTGCCLSSEWGSHAVRGDSCGQRSEGDSTTCGITAAAALRESRDQTVATPTARTQQAVAEGQAMFRREAQTLAALNNFHVVQVYDYFDEGGRCYLVEEYVRGQTLQQRIAARGRMALDEAVPIAAQVLEALEYLHGLTPPLLHRDLKPENIILAPASGGEVVKLIDFGIARHFQVQRGTVHGTPGYAAPEQYRGMSEPRTDLYALGGILHFALSGRDPQEHEPFSFPPLASLRPDLPPALCGLVDQALANEAEHRPANAAEFKHRLLSAAHGAPQPHAPGPQAPTVVLPQPAPPLHPAPPSAVTASKIEWTPAQVEFTGVERGGTVAAATVTVRNTGRGTLEAQVGTDTPQLLRVSPHHIAENQAQLRVEVESSAVVWGHRYRCTVNLMLDHGGGAVAIPVVITAADNHAVLARVRSLSLAALIIPAALALIGEMMLAQSAMTISRTLHGALAAQVGQAADAFVTFAMLAAVGVLVVTRRRHRLLTIIGGLLAIGALHQALAAILIDYLLFPALVAGMAQGSAILLRRPCIRFLARNGLGIWSRLRALALIAAAPAAALVAGGIWMLSAASAPAVTASSWTPPAYTPEREFSTPYPAASYAPHHATREVRRPAPEEFKRRPARTPVPPELIEARIRERLSTNGFDGIGVSVEPSGRVYLSGSARDVDQRSEIESLVRGVAGVRGVIADLQLPKGWMGITVGSSGGGAAVQYLMPQSPADRAGIELNDVIVAIDGEPIHDRADFHHALESKAAGQMVTVTLNRGGQTLTVSVHLRKKPLHNG